MSNIKNIKPQLITWLKGQVRGQGGWIYARDTDMPVELMTITTLLHHNLIEFDEYNTETGYLRYTLTGFGEIAVGIGEMTIGEAESQERFQVASSKWHNLPREYAVVDTHSNLIVPDSHTDFEHTAKEYARQLNIRARNNVLPFDNDAPAAPLDKGGEWHHTSDGTEFPTVYNDAYSFTLESFAESLNLHKVLRQYAVEKESARVRIAELENVASESIQQRDAAYRLYEGKHERLEQLHRDLEVAQNARKVLEAVINDAFKELRTYDGDNGAIIAARIMLEPYTEPKE